MWTTSRYSSEKARERAEKLAASGNSRYVARGKKTIAQLVELARKSGEERIMVVEEDGIREIEVLPTGKWRWNEGKR